MILPAMAGAQFHLFDTAIGRCALIWRQAVFIGAQLPERDEAAARARIARRFPEASEAVPQGFVAAAIADIRALTETGRRDLAHLPIDLAGVSAFEQAVYGVARAIAPGATLTYGEVARRIGEPGAARAVGAALGANPWPIIVPCHRVLAAGGRAGGFSAEGGTETKMRLLTIERARTGDAPSLFEVLPLQVRPR